MRSLLLGALLLGACGTRVDVPAPTQVDPPPVAPDPPASTVGLPVSINLENLLQRVEDAVPRTRSREDEWHPLGRTPVLGTVYLKEMWERDALTVTLDGNTVQVGALVRYRARVAERACLPGVGCRWVPLASCGHDGAMPTIRVGIRTELRWRRDWTVVPETRALPVQPGIPCRLTEARIDVTGRVAGAVQGALDSVAPRVDEELARRSNLRELLGEVWGTLQEPVRVADSVHLQFRPDSVSITPPAARGSGIGTVVSVRMSPRVVIGPRPDPDTVPLPPLRMGSRAPGFRVAFTAEIDYATASRLVREALVGSEIEMPGGHSLRIRRVMLYGNGTRLVARVGIGGDARGTLYLEGTPSYDPATRSVVVPDLDFTVESRNALAGPAVWLLHDHLRDRMREAAHFPVGERMDRLHGEVNQALSRPLGRTARLNGRVDRWTVRGIAVTQSGIATLGEASGEARVTVVVR